MYASTAKAKAIQARYYPTLDGVFRRIAEQASKGDFKITLHYKMASGRMYLLNQLQEYDYTVIHDDKNDTLCISWK